MQNKPPHTFTWLKVFIAFFIATLLALLLFLSWGFSFPVKNAPGILSFLNPTVFLFVSLTCLSGLIFGIVLNLLAQFRLPILFYSLGHILAIILLTFIAYQQFNTYIQAPIAISSESHPTINDSNAISVIMGDDKHAIEEVIFLMEQQYPFGAYDIVDIITEPALDDSSTIACTLVFTLKEEANTYISQYLVKDGPPQAVYVKKDTRSSAYLEYKLKKTSK